MTKRAAIASALNAGWRGFLSDMSTTGLLCPSMSHDLTMLCIFRASTNEIHSVNVNMTEAGMCGMCHFHVFRRPLGSHAKLLAQALREDLAMELTDAEYYVHSGTLPVDAMRVKDLVRLAVRQWRTVEKPDYVQTELPPLCGVA